MNGNSYFFSRNEKSKIMKPRVKIIILITIVITSMVCCEKVHNPFDSICPQDLWTPEGFTIDQEGNALVLNWGQPIEHIEGFKIERKVGNGDWSNLATLEKTARTWTDENLIGEQLHTYQIFAFAGDNESNKVTNNETPTLIKPSVTTNNVQEVSYNWATLAGEVNPNSLETAVSFQYKETAVSEWKTITAEPKTINGSSIQTVTADLQNLTPATEYHYSVVAESDAGKSTSEELVTFSTEEVVLNLSAQSVIVSNLAGTLEISVKTNYENMEISSNVLWLNAEFSGNTLKISYSANNSVDQRQGILTILAGELEKTIVITQRGGQL